MSRRYQIRVRHNWFSLVYSGRAENDPKEQYRLSLMYTDTNKPTVNSNDVMLLRSLSSAIYMIMLIVKNGKSLI